VSSVKSDGTYPSTWVVRLLGILNLVFAGLGLLALVIDVAGFLELPWPFTEGLARFFFRMDIASLFLLSSLAYAGIQLLRRSCRAPLLCSIVLCAEIVFLLVLWPLWGLPMSPLSIRAVQSGFMNLGFALQVITAYPVVGLILLGLSRRDA
jgi:hypothetical protein